METLARSVFGKMCASNNCNLFGIFLTKVTFYHSLVQRYITWDLHNSFFTITFLNKASGIFFLRMMTFLELYFFKYYYISRKWKNTVILLKTLCIVTYPSKYVVDENLRITFINKISGKYCEQLLVMKLLIKRHSKFS